MEINNKGSEDIFEHSRVCMDGDNLANVCNAVANGEPWPVLNSTFVFNQVLTDVTLT